jgi:hypothetical protein
MEVDAALAPDRRGLEEQVHEHRLADADRTPQEGAPDAARLAKERGARLGESAFHPREGFDGAGLDGVRRELSGPDPPPVDVAQPYAPSSFSTKR